MRTFELYRYTHTDGTAKEWAYADLGNGQAEIRWGPANQLRQSQTKPLHVAEQRAREKLRKGYSHLGAVTLNAHGYRPLSPTTASTTAGATPAAKPVDLKALLGTDDNFYF